jgi:hypothetical protein
VKVDAEANLNEEMVKEGVLESWVGRRCLSRRSVLAMGDNNVGI